MITGADPVPDYSAAAFRPGPQESIRCHAGRRGSTLRGSLCAFVPAVTSLPLWFLRKEYSSIPLSVKRKIALCLYFVPGFDK